VRRRDGGAADWPSEEGTRVRAGDARPSTEMLRAAFARSAGAVPAVTDRMQRRDARGALLPRPAGPPEGTGALPAAVLVLLYPRAGRLRVVLTQRAAHLPQHGGQISFPGGAVDAEDPSPLAAALRETREELGVQPRPLAVWGELEPVYVPTSGYLIRAFVAHAEARPAFRPAAGEVAGLLEPALDELLQRGGFASEERVYHGQTVWEPFFWVDGERVWGATAVLLDQLLTRIEVGLAAGTGAGDPGPGSAAAANPVRSRREHHK
jgi:8-oxo-dGTP pyrophosphatase MutT (NUDIX family)